MARNVRAWQITSAGVGAIAVIAVAGEGARACVSELGAGADRIPVAGIKRITLNFLGREIDDVLIVRRSERHFEIHAHGGLAVVERILEALRALGVRVSMSAEDYTAVSCAMGVSSISAPAILSEVLAALAEVDNPFALRLLASQHQQGLAEWAGGSIRRLQATPESAALWRVQAQARWILERAMYLRHFLHPPRIALIGKPNAGKSTLLNALAGRNASIVSDIAGTTRDWIDVTIRLTAGGVSLNAMIVDTAGLRATDDHLEREAIVRTQQQTRQADVIVLVLDGTSDFPDDFKPMIAEEYSPSARLICAVNKMDIPSAFPARRSSGKMRDVYISALCGDGIDDLQSAILAALGVSGCDPATPMVWTARQRRILESLTVAEAASSAVLLLKDLLT